MENSDSAVAAALSRNSLKNTKFAVKIVLLIFIFNKKNYQNF